MKKELKADMWLLSVTVVWGLSFPVMSIALKSIGPYTFLFFRYLISAIILSVIFHKRFKNINRKVLKVGGLIGAALTLGCSFQMIGISYTTPSKAGFITGTNVILVPIFLAIIYKKFPDKRTIIGVALSMTGLMLMSFSKDMKINIGDLITFFGAVFFATQLILVDRLVKNVDIMLLTCIEMIVIAAFAFIPTVYLEGLALNFDIFSIGAILYMAIFCTIYAYTIQNKMQPNTNPTHAAIIFLAEPVFAAIFSLFIGDRLTGKALIGCIFILLGMLVIELKWTNMKYIKKIGTGKS